VERWSDRRIFGRITSWPLVEGYLIVDAPEDWGLSNIMSDSLTKNQHFVPQTYLRKFVNQDTGNLYCFDIPARRGFQPKPGQVAAQNWFYEIEDIAPNAVEKLLSRWEMRIPHVVDVVERAGQSRLKRKRPWLRPISHADRLELTWLMVVQLFRTPSFRTRWMKYVEDAHGDNLDAGSLHSNWLMNPSTYDRYVSFWSTFHLSILAAPQGTSFWTSDNPVAVTFGAGRGNGLGTGHPWIHFPITPTVMIELRDPASIVGKLYTVYQITKSHVDWYNTLQVASAKRQVYASDPLNINVCELLDAQPALVKESLQLERRGREQRKPTFEILSP